MSSSGFNPRPPCGERPRRLCFRNSSSLFQSTPSLRRATASGVPGITSCKFQSTPSLRRATPGLFVPSFCRGFQSTPSLRRATPWPLQRRNGFRFQSTPSLRRATPTGPRPVINNMFQSTPSLRRATAPTVHVVNQSCKRGFAPTSRRRYITYRLLFIILGCQSAFSNVLQESPTSRQFDVSLGLAQRPCQTALK